MKTLNTKKSVDILSIEQEAMSGQKSAAVVTTNGIVKNNGYAVMGAGIAKFFRDTYGADLQLGKKLKESGNHAYYFDKMVNRISTKNLECRVITMPTKNDWHDDSDIKLIERSCIEMVEIADKNNLQTIYMPQPGCANGHLDWNKDVKPVIEKILDDRFIVTIGFR